MARALQRQHHGAALDDLGRVQRQQGLGRHELHVQVGVHAALEPKCAVARDVVPLAHQEERERAHPDAAVGLRGWRVMGSFWTTKHVPLKVKRTTSKSFGRKSTKKKAAAAAAAAFQAT